MRLRASSISRATSHSGMGGADLNQYQADELAGFSAGRLRQMQDVAGLYSPYTVSPKNQAIWEA